MRNHLVAGATAVGAWVVFLFLWSVTIGFLFPPDANGDYHPLVAIGAFVGATVAAIWAYVKVLDSRSETAPDGTKARP